MDTVQRPYPGVELLVWYLVLQPIQAVLPEVNIHKFLQLPVARAWRTARLAFQYDFKIVWACQIPFMCRQTTLSAETTTCRPSVKLG
jgi:hypothetical protein